MWLLLQITVFSKYNEDPKCYMFLESSQKTLIEYHHDNVQIHGHGPWVCPSIGLTPSVVCFWNCHTKCWWNKTSAMPISVAMAMAMSIFEYFGSCWTCFWLAELRSASPWNRNVTKWVSESQFSKMTRANTRASNKEKLDMVLLCILSQFGLV